MSDPAGGWVVGGAAVYLHRPASHREVGIWIQYGDDKPIRLGVLADERAAQEFRAWLDAGLTAVGLVNSELTRRLEERTHDQPQSPPQPCAGEEGRR